MTYVQRALSRNSGIRTAQTAVEEGETNMLWYTVVFLIIAIIAAILGFGVLGAIAATIAKICFVIFIILFLIGLLTGRRRAL